MKKLRILSFLLCALLVVSALPLGVSAKETEIAEVGADLTEVGTDIAEVGMDFFEVDTYDELRDTLKSLETLGEDCTIMLTDDIYLKDNKNNYELIVPAYRKVYLDLNGYSITRVTQGNDVALFRIKSDATLRIFDTSGAQTGACTFSEGYSNYNKAVFCNEGGTLRIESGYFEILSPYEQGECSVIRTTSGLTEIYGGTFDSSAAWGGDSISVGHDAYFYEVPQVIIFGGDFYGKYQSIDISPMNNFLGFGSLFPNVFVLGGNFYICNKGTDKITPGFCYCNNWWGRVIIAEGSVYARSLNMIDQRYLTGSTKKLFSQTIDDFTGGYYEVSAPPMIMPSGEDKYGEFYFVRLGLLCSKEVTRSYNEETYLMYKELFDSIRSTYDTIYVGELETEAPEIKLINRTTDIKYINWYVCDEAEYMSGDANWTYLGDYDNVVQWQFTERPEEGKSYLVRCVVTKADATSYEDVIRIEFEPLKTAEVIDSVEITGLTTPAVGGNPDFELTPAEDGYYINLLRWTDVTDSKNPRSLKETDTFEAGHKYEFEVWLRTEDGYKFIVDSDEWIDITATIDTREAEVVLPGAEKAAIIRMEFSIPESRVISEVDVVDVTKPLEGEKPDMEAFCITRGCNVTSVKWYDITDGGYVLMGENDTFQAGRTYRVNVMVETEGNYTFLMVDRYNEAGGYINGVRAIAGAADEDFWLQLGYVFAPCEENPNKPTDPVGPSDPVGPTDPPAPAVKGLLGDADGNGTVNIKDATAIQKHVAGLITLADAGVKLADVDANTSVNIKDATAIQKHIAGMETGFAIGELV